MLSKIRKPSSWTKSSPFKSSCLPLLVGFGFKFLARRSSLSSVDPAPSRPLDRTFYFWCFIFILVVLYKNFFYLEPIIFQVDFQSGHDLCQAQILKLVVETLWREICPHAAVWYNPTERVVSELYSAAIVLVCCLLPFPVNRKVR